MNVLLVNTVVTLKPPALTPLDHSSARARKVTREMDWVAQVT